MRIPNCCPNCGDRYNWNYIGDRREPFNQQNAVMGAIMFGPMGLLGGATGKAYKVYQCGKCGYIQQY